MSLNDLALVIAVKDGEKTIEACLHSLAPAVADGARLYVYDALSTDGTREIVERQFPAVHYVYEADGGLYFAWNRALHEVGEKYLFYINCDDEIVSVANLNALLERLRQTDSLFACGGKTVMTRQDGAVRYAGKAPQRDWYVGDMPIITPATVFSVKALRQCNGYDTNYRISADYDLVLRMLRRYGHRSFAFVDLPITCFSLGGMSNQLRGKAFAEIDTIIRKNLGVGKLQLHRLVCRWIGLKRAMLNVYFKLSGQA